ncbi:MAG: alkyl sulfatase C-terminal domain-containing protein [Dehalococcoidia bacterium]
MFFDLLAVRLNGPKAAGAAITLNLDFTDIDEQFVLTVANGVLNYAKGKKAPDPDAALTLTRAALDEVLLGEATLAGKLAAGQMRIDGNREKLGELLAMLDTFDFWFNIVTP